MRRLIGQIAAGAVVIGFTVAYFGQGCLSVVQSRGPSSVVGGSLEARTRRVLTPYFVDDPSQMLIKDHQNTPWDQFYLAVRYQWPNWADPDSTAFRYTTEYNTISNTGIGPWPAFYQRGPLGGAVDQSVFQLKGHEVGVLMRSWDSPHPAANGGYPVCAPNCTGYEKHTIYEYRWSDPVPAFTLTQNPEDTEVGLAIDADLQILQMEQWSTVDNGPPKGLVAGQFAWVVFFQDPAGKRVQFVIFAFHSSAPSYNGGETVVLEPIGDGNNGYYITTSFARNSGKLYVTTVSPEDDFSHTTWSGFKHFSAFISPKNLANAIQALNAKGAGLSPDVLSYRLAQVGLNQEVHYENNGDAFVMGSSYKNFGVSEKHH